MRDVAALTEDRQRIAPADPGAAEEAGRDRKGAGGRAAEVARAGPSGGQSQRFDRQGRAGPRQRQPRRAGGRARRRKAKDNRIDLAALNDPGRLAPAVAFASARGRLPFPVNGVRIREFGAPDGLGGTEKGISIATRPGAQVTAPCDGWVVYAGPFRNYGQVLILNAGGGYHVVLAGMDRISVECRPVRADRGARGGDGWRLRQRSRRSLGDRLRAPTSRCYTSSSARTVLPIDPSPWWAASKGEKVRG